MDRIDLKVDVPAVTAFDLIRPAPAEASAAVKARVEAARSVQAERYAALGLSGSMVNAHCPAALIETIAEPDTPGARLLSDAAEQMKFSARAYHRILKVARTLADLEGEEIVRRVHLAEAISYRMAGERLRQAA